jgi:hypothetical protein
MLLADHANDDGICWPGQKGIAVKAGMTERQTRRHIAKLLTSGLITVERLKREDGSLWVNRYTLQLPKMSCAQDAHVLLDRTPMSYQEPSVEPGSVNNSPNVSPSVAKRGRRATTTAPLTYPITLEMESFYVSEGLTTPDAERETAAMLDYFRAKGETRADWTATWRNWIRNSKRFNRGNGNGRTTHKTKQDYTRENCDSLLADIVAEENRSRSKH